MNMEKRFNKVWNGVAWVQIYHPTSADLIDVGNGKKLDVKLAEMETTQNEHAIDAAMHTSPADKVKLANLAANANGTYATKTELEALEAASGGNTEDAIAELKGEIAIEYATKAEVAGKTITKYFTSIEDRDAAIPDLPDGTPAWVVIPKVPGQAQVATKYVLVDGTWEFLFETDANVVILWDDIEGKPFTDEEWANVQALAHGHVNAEILNEFDVNDDNELTWKGKELARGNVTFFQDDEPTKRIVGDVWLAPMN